MGLRKIVTEGYESLYKKCRPVENFDKRLELLAQDLIDTLDNADGVGLAAPQVGVTRRVVVVIDDDDTSHIVLVNPKIVRSEGEQEFTEGCLSVPGGMGSYKSPREGYGSGTEYKGRIF